MGKTEVECCDVTCVHDDMIQKVKKLLPAEGLLNELADFYYVVLDRLEDVIDIVQEDAEEIERYLPADSASSDF